MATRKRNEWLETGASDDEDQSGYESDDQKDSRGAQTGRSVKRRRVEQGVDSGSDSDRDSEDVVASKLAPSASSPFVFEETVGDEDEDITSEQELGALPDEDEDEDDNDSTGLQSTSRKDAQIKSLTARKLEKSQKAAKKTGVVYLSRVPPFMKPATLKQLLTPYGEIGRIFLTPEDSVQHQRRVRSGGNKKKSFVDGWVEFIDKKNAKIVAESLNSNIVGGKKGSFYYDDVWNMKYLKGFKWHHLTDQIANENAERAARLRAEISKTRRENKKFVDDIDRAKMLEGMQAKKKAKQERAGVPAVASTAPDTTPKDERRRQFQQNQVKLKQVKDGARMNKPETAEKVMTSLW